MLNAAATIHSHITHPQRVRKPTSSCFDQTGQARALHHVRLNSRGRANPTRHDTNCYRPRAHEHQRTRRIATTTDYGIVALPIYSNQILIAKCASCRWRL